MKKYIAFFMALSLLLFTGCKKENPEETTEYIKEEETTEEFFTTVKGLGLPEDSDKRVMTVYFSCYDSIEKTAMLLNEEAEGDMFRIETVNEYPENEEELIKRAASEHEKNIRPALKKAPGSLTDYDIIFLCFPIWDSTMPMALFTFIEDYDMREKAVIPVIEGNEEQLINAVRDIHSLVPEMTIVDGFTYEGDVLSALEELSGFADRALYGQ